MEEDKEICRVCRSEGTQEQPLFYPCKCSGSIRYVHQDCLLEWLEHSNKRYCELCKYKFSFTPIYSPEMPETIPKSVLIGRAIEKLAKVTRLILRGILVAVIWLVMLPYFTIWIWRLYFWIGETFAFRANGLETPLWNSTSFFTSRPNITTAASTSTTGADRALKGISLLLFQTIPPEHLWISKFILDCFEGQIISSVVMVVFVAIFLLREWVLQNQEGEGVRMAMNDGAAPAAGAEADAHGFNMEHAVERFIAVQHHIEAVVEGEADLSDDDMDEAENDAAEQQDLPQPSTSLQPSSPNTEPMDLLDFRNQSVDSRNERNIFNPEQRPRFFWESENMGEGSSSSGPTSLNPTMAPLGSWPSEAGTAAVSSSEFATSAGLAVRPSNERTFSSDPTTGIYPSTPTVDSSGRRPRTLDGGMNQGISFRATEDIPVLDNVPALAPRVGYIYDSLNQTYHPDTRSVASSSSSSSVSASTPRMDEDVHQQGLQSVSGTPNGESTSGGAQQPLETMKGPIKSGSGEPLYWKVGIPLTYENVYLKEDGSEMEFSEQVARYEDLCRTGNLGIADVWRLPSMWRSTHVGQAERLAEEQTIAQVLGSQEGYRQAMIRRINEHDIQVQAGNDVVAAVPDLNLAAVRWPHVPRPAAAAEQEDEQEDMNVEELNGILEVIGMQGSYWVLLQNSLLMSALICASLGLGVWIPFMIGKTVLLMNPLSVLRLPLALLSRLTDPLLDYIFDRMLPLAGSTFFKAASAFSSKVSPHVASVTGSYLGGAAIKPLEMLYEDHVLPAWYAIVEISTTGATPEFPKDAAAVVMDNLVSGDSVANTTIATNATVVHHVVRKWTELAYGSTSGDKFAAISIGYVILFAIASWYFARTQHAYGHTFARVARDVLRQQGLILKIAFFVAMDMIVFPLFCGVVIGVSTLPIFKGASIATRIAFYKLSPSWSLIMHWLVGTAFMFNFAFFVGLSRGMVRPGVMWFIRDPNDEGFHPVREILERPVMLQLRKLGSGAIMYFTLILLGVTVTIHSVNVLMKGVLPLRWPVDEPISDLPIDLLLFHLVFPLTALWFEPADRLKILFGAWWRKLAHWLRLSSFMYASYGQRYYDEEGYFAYRSWKAWLLRWRPPIPGADQAEDETTGSGEELDIDAPVIFVRDGGLLRVPNNDRIFHLKDRRVLVPVDENGNALDPNEDLPGEMDPLMEVQMRLREGPIDPKENTIVIYAPPHFRYRLMSFIVLIWTSVSTFLVLSVVVPMVLGRAIFMVKTEREVHDIYSIIVGVYFLGGLWFFLNWTSRKISTIFSQGLQPIDLRAQLKAAWGLCRIIAKLVYFSLTFGIIMPFMLGLMVELFVIIPLRTTVEDETGIIFVVNWAVGLLYMKTIHRILSVMPNNRFAVDMNRVFVGTNVSNWDAGLATRRLILPVVGMTALAMGGPLALAWIVVEGFELAGPTRVRVFRQSYPVVMILGLVIFGLKESMVILRGWSQYVRDQEYLVGRQLHNLQEEVQQREQQPAVVLENGLQPEQAQEREQEQVHDVVEPLSDRHQSVEPEWEENYVDAEEDQIFAPQEHVCKGPRVMAERLELELEQEPAYVPPLLRSNSRLVEDPPLASESLSSD